VVQEVFTSLGNEMRMSTPVQQTGYAIPATAGSRLQDCLLQRDLLPDWLVRVGIRRLLSDRLRERAAGGLEQQASLSAFIRRLRASPLAIETAAT